VAFAGSTDSNRDRGVVRRCARHALGAASIGRRVITVARTLALGVALCIAVALRIANAIAGTVRRPKSAAT
jgi:hypothetical protein